MSAIRRGGARQQQKRQQHHHQQQHTNTHPLAAPQHVELRQPAGAHPRRAGAGGVDRLARRLRRVLLRGMLLSIVVLVHDWVVGGVSGALQGKQPKAQSQNTSHLATTTHLAIGRLQAHYRSHATSRSVDCRRAPDCRLGRAPAAQAAIRRRLHRGQLHSGGAFCVSLFTSIVSQH